MVKPWLVGNNSELMLWKWWCTPEVDHLWPWLEPPGKHGKEVGGWTKDGLVTHICCHSCMAIIVSTTGCSQWTPASVPCIPGGSSCAMHRIFHLCLPIYAYSSYTWNYYYYYYYCYSYCYHYHHINLRYVKHITCILRFNPCISLASRPSPPPVPHRTATRTGSPPPRCSPRCRIWTPRAWSDESWWLSGEAMVTWWWMVIWWLNGGGYGQLVVQWWFDG